MTSISASNSVDRTVIRGQFVSTVLKLISDGIAKLRANKTVNPGMDENSISARLYLAMEEIHRGSDSDILNFALRPIHPLPRQPNQAVEPDFTFHYDVMPRGNRKFLAVEAKRLRGAGSTMAGPYVFCGVRRFVQGRYSLRHDHAVMLGYVVAAPLANAIQQVKYQMDSRSIETAQQIAFVNVSATWNLANTYSSKHMQIPTCETFTLLHFFVDLS